MNLPEFSPELKVVLECARYGGAREDVLRALLERASPERLKETATRHGLAPLCHQQISRFDSLESLDVTAPLNRAWLANVRACVHLAHELECILGAFDAGGIPVIPFKGPTLAQSAYGEIYLRQAGDIDLLIRPGDLAAATSELTAIGLSPQQTFSPTQRERLLKNDCAVYFRRGTDGVILDLHWRFLPSYVPIRFDYDAWFDRPPSACFDGRGVRALTRENLLFYLLLHGSLHTWCRVVHFTDVLKQIESQGDWDWRELLRQATEAGIRKTFLVGLTACSDLLNWPLPGELRAVSEAKIETSAKRTIKRLAEDGGKQPGNVGTWGFRMRMVDNRKGTAEWAFKRLVLPSASDWRFVSVPDRFYFLYYLLRWVRLGWLFLGFVLGLLFRRK